METILNAAERHFKFYASANGHTFAACVAVHFNGTFDAFTRDFGRENWARIGGGRLDASDRLAWDGGADDVRNAIGNRTFGPIAIGA